MRVPDALIELQLRNCAIALEALADDPRAVPVFAGTCRGVATSLRDIALIVAQLPPFEP